MKTNHKPSIPLPSRASDTDFPLGTGIEGFFTPMNTINDYEEENRSMREHLEWMQSEMAKLIQAYADLYAISQKGEKGHGG